MSHILMVWLREDPTHDITQESVKVIDSLSGECARETLWFALLFPSYTHTHLYLCLCCCVYLCFSQEVNAAQYDLRELGGLRRGGIQSRIVSDVFIYIFTARLRSSCTVYERECVFCLLSVKRPTWCIASLTSRCATKSSRRRWGSWSRWWRAWRTATRGWRRRTSICTTRPGCKMHSNARSHTFTEAHDVFVDPRPRLSSAHRSQLLAQKEKLLKEEVEEMKATLSCTEEGRARASAHSKHVVSETQAAPGGSRFSLISDSWVLKEYVEIQSSHFLNPQRLNHI